MDDEEREFWCRAALRAQRAILNKLDHHRKNTSPAGTAHMAAEYADALLAEFQRRFRQSAGP